MNLKCVKANRSLVKGAIYECLKTVMISGNTNRFFRPYVVIKSLGHYLPEYFTLENGDPIPVANWLSPEYGVGSDYKTWVENPEQLKQGEILVCERESSKYLRRGEFYKIVEVNKVQRGSSGRWFDVKVKIEGYQRWLAVGAFRRATQQELRQIQLSNLFDEKIPDMRVQRHIRKFDRNSQEVKMRILLEATCKSLLDPKRNNLSVMDWAIEKIEPKLDLTASDFDLIKHLDIERLLRL